MVWSLILMSLLVLGHPSHTVHQPHALQGFYSCSVDVVSEERKDAVPGPHLALVAPSSRG
ncbi:hypothetical protein BT96DRAFT_914222, partial [Gymnopus androsaceus JB14]